MFTAEGGSRSRWGGAAAWAQGLLWPGLLQAPSPLCCCGDTRHKDCFTKARSRASTRPLTLRAKLKKGLWTALKTVGRTLVSCQPELAAGQTQSDRLLPCSPCCAWRHRRMECGWWDGS
ncbi:hypothetical protein WJX82_009348 [Trebouxia sp. C0006]